jgi:CRISPR-associated protein Cas2
MGVAMVTRRQQRINQLLRDEIDRLLRHEADDPVLASMISITGVEVTQDLQKAKIFVSFLDDDAQKEIMQRLRKAAKHLEGYGERMQYSVFRCWLTAAQMQKLRWELTELLAAEDEALLLRLCSRCVGGIQGTHTAVKQPSWPEEPEGHKIL